MRKKDEEKSTSFGKATKTINFDKHVLKELESKAKLHSTTVSNMINSMAKDILISEVEFHSFMARQYYLKFQEHQYLKSQAEIKVTVRQ